MMLLVRNYLCSLFLRVNSVERFYSKWYKWTTKNDTTWRIFFSHLAR